MRDPIFDPTTSLSRASDGFAKVKAGEELERLLVGILQLLRYEVEVIPARVGEQSRVDRQSDVTGLGVGAGHWMLEIFRVSHAEPPESSYHDDYQREDLGCSEDVLYSGRPFDIVAINGSQQTCG